MSRCAYSGCAEKQPLYTVVFRPVNTELHYCEDHADAILAYFAQKHDESELYTPPRERSLRSIGEELGIDMEVSPVDD